MFVLVLFHSEDKLLLMLALKFLLAVCIAMSVAVTWDEEGNIMIIFFV